MEALRVLCRVLGIALVALLALIILPVAAQEPVGLHAVEPSSGRPGEELTLALIGQGFGGAERVEVGIGGIDILDTWVESDEVVRARIFIPEDAPPGPRPVEVFVSFGQNEEFAAALEGGFSVQEAAGPLPGPDGGGLGWVLVLGPVVLIGAAVAGVTMVKARQSALNEKWQQQAQEGELPQTCQEGAHFVRRETVKLKPGRWRVAGLTVLLYDAASGQRGPEREAPPELVKRIDRAARQRLLQGERAEQAQEVRDIGRELGALIVAWQSLSEDTRDAQATAQLEGGEASATFALYRCTGQPGQWEKVKEWTAKLKAVDTAPQTFRGPAAEETAAAYQELLQGHLGRYVQELTAETARLLDVKGLAVSVKG